MATALNISNVTALWRDKILEPYEGKLSRTVLRRESESNLADLVDTISATVLKKSLMQS